MPNGFGTIGGGVGRIFQKPSRPANIENHYVVGSGVGAKSRAVRKALRRRASNNAEGYPCCYPKVVLNFEKHPRTIPSAGPAPVPGPPICQNIKTVTFTPGGETNAGWKPSSRPSTTVWNIFKNKYEGNYCEQPLPASLKGIQGVTVWKNNNGYWYIEAPGMDPACGSLMRYLYDGPEASLYNLVTKERDTGNGSFVVWYTQPTSCYLLFQDQNSTEYVYTDYSTIPDAILTVT